MRFTLISDDLRRWLLRVLSGHYSANQATVSVRPIGDILVRREKTSSHLEPSAKAF